MSGTARVSPQTQYWTDAVSEACESVGLSVSIHELCEIAKAMEMAHENYRQAFYQPPAGEHLTKENRDLRTKLAIEESKVVCPACGGRGIETSNGPVHSSVSTCWKCNGDKKVSP